MTHKAFCLTVIAAAAFCFLVAPASATHVQCGDVITTSTTLDSDVVCPDTFQSYGLRIGADNVLLRMNGFTIRGGTGGGGTGIVSASQDQLQGVGIKRGSIEGFMHGIALQTADDTTIYRVNVTTLENPPFAGARGITVGFGDRNQVLLSNVTLNGNDPRGILLTGDDAYAWGNVVTGNATADPPGWGIAAQGERPRIVYNQVTNCGPSPGMFTSYPGVSVFGYTDFAVVNRNTVSGCPTGARADSAVGAPGGARVALNQTSGGTIGILVNDPGAVVRANTAREASGTGIEIGTPFTVVRNNGAFDNGIVGIAAREFSVDGGGNVASGNGDGTTPQCVNVECSSP